ncbi:MAG: polysaccharide deacetylase family protein [Bryobacteraceae bacterium]|nr:polysaccharide deacetylase family protein [Bryobacteraceae bacterium]
MDCLRGPQRTVGGPLAPAIVAGSAGAAGFLTWAVRGRSSTVFAPSIWRGNSEQRELALTFDDGPSESTPELLEVLERFGVSATFFLCGVPVRRLPGIARLITQSKHELGNHTDSHARLWLRSRSFISTEVGLAQRTIADVTGVSPQLFRAPYGVRWPGLGAVQREHGLTGVMWSVIGNDWALPADRIAARVLRGVQPGAIVCLHDGRELRVNPDIRPTIGAVRTLIPRLRNEGWTFRSVRDWIG